MMTRPSGSADGTEVREIQEPRPGPGEVTIGVTHAGINFMDVMARRGDTGYAAAWPYAPGLEVTGTVLSAGPGVSGLAPGQTVAAFTAGGVDIVLDPLGTSMLETDLAITAPGGRIVLFGNAGGGDQALLPPPARLIGGNLAIAGFSITRLWTAAPHRARAGLSRVLELIADGRLEIAITEVSALTDVPAVHQLLAEGHGTGKYVVRLRP